MIENNCGIYFIKTTDGIRIGQSKNIKSRFSSHKSSNYNITILAILNCLKNELNAEEQKAFNFFKDYHIQDSFYKEDISEMIDSYIVKRTLEKNNIADKRAARGTFIGTLYGSISSISIRPNCDIFPDQKATIMGRAGGKQTYRKIIIEGKTYTVSEKFKKLYQAIVRDTKEKCTN